MTTREPYRPREVVHLDAATLARVAAEGLAFRREVERRARLVVVRPDPRAAR